MDIVIRAACMYVFILVVTRIVGRRELSSLEPFDLVLLIVVGDLVQQGVTQNDFSFTGLMLAIGTIAVLQTFVSWVGFHSKKAGLVLDGEPIVVVQDGRFLDKNLKRERIQVNEVLEAARKKEGIASVAEIQWAIFETGGEFSFIKKTAAS